MNINKIKENMKTKIKDKNGFLSIEAILSSVVILMCVYLAIGLFCWIYPRLGLEKEVQALTQKAKIQGGLTNIASQPTNSDIEVFKDSLVKLGYTRSEIEIQAKTVLGGNSVIGVTPLNAKGDNYVKRDSKEQMQIVVKVPAESFIKGPLRFFKVSTTSDSLSYHYIYETVMSERW